MDDELPGLWVLDGRTPRRATVGEWSGTLEDVERRRVALTDLGGVRVSTVFLGVDHGFGSSSRPVLFETMIFAPEHPSLDTTCRRYATWDEAERGHAACVELARSALATGQQ